MAGLIVALAGERRLSARLRPRPASGQPGPVTSPVPWTLFLVCMFLAALPDLDYIYPPSHRGPTHSIGAAALVTLIAAAVTRWSTGHVRWRIVAVCGFAYLSHIVMDWLGADPTPTPGVMALWPLSDRLFISGWELFRSTTRINAFTPGNIVHNSLTLAKEMAILAPILIAVWWRRRTAG